MRFRNRINRYRSVLDFLIANPYVGRTIMDIKTNKKIPCVLTIAGSDSGGGAGIQADIKTMSANGCFSASVITSVTAQNTMGVEMVYDLPAEVVTAQLDAVFKDIEFSCVKIGMLSNAEIIDTVADKLEEYKIAPVALDPVMVSTSGHALLRPDARESLKRRMIKLAKIVTPNIPEAEELSGIKITDIEDMKNAARIIGEMGAEFVLVKGGHSTGDEATDILFKCDTGESRTYSEKRVNTKNTHGTGCTLSSAIAANLAKGYDPFEAVERAKKYLTAALENTFDIGHGRGPVNHNVEIRD